MLIGEYSDKYRQNDRGAADHGRQRAAPPIVKHVRRFRRQLGLVGQRLRLVPSGARKPHLDPLNRRFQCRLFRLDRRLRDRRIDRAKPSHQRGAGAIVGGAALACVRRHCGDGAGQHLFVS